MSKLILNLPAESAERLVEDFKSGRLQSATPYFPIRSIRLVRRWDRLAAAALLAACAAAVAVVAIKKGAKS